jgi:Na+-transporting methylmalonyl-CoA/oxaloacetate decarboxylase gamma subunit
MWWMYIGLGVVVAFLVIFVFAMLAASSTDIGESPRADSHLK